MNPNTIDSIIKQLIASHTTISTMESCTSGLIASLITDTEGASAIFPGGYVTYLNETKVLVGVDPSVIEIHRMRRSHGPHSTRKPAHRHRHRNHRHNRKSRPQQR